MPTTSSGLPRKRVWFITGTSQGFGRELVRAALGRGDSVVATSRHPEKVAAEFDDSAERLLAVPMDLRNAAEIAAAVDSAIARFGRIDVLVNNAGHGLLGAVEEASDAEIADVFETNVLGLLRVSRAVLPHLREQRSGRIVNISSIGGLTATPGWGIYCSTKFAVEGLSEALSQELAPLGVRVTLVEPGPFRTDFLGASLAVAARKISDYESTAGRTRDWSRNSNGRQMGDPARGAKAIVNTVTLDDPPLHLLLGSDAYERATKKVGALLDEFKQWREVAMSTDFA